MVPLDDVSLILSAGPLSYGRYVRDTILMKYECERVKALMTLMTRTYILDGRRTSQLNSRRRTR